MRLKKSESFDAGAGNLFTPGTEGSRRVVSSLNVNRNNL